MDVWGGIVAVPDEIKAAVVSFAEVGVPAVFVKNSMPSVQELPVQTVQADTIIEAPVICVHHVGK